MNTFLIIIVAILIGLVEGITEWLPVSSTGHIIIVESLFNVNDMFTHGKDFISCFEVIIQFFAIIAVIIFFFNKLWPFGKKSEERELDKQIKTDIWFTWLKVIIACVPAAILGLLLDDILDTYLYNALTVSITLIVYGILFILLEFWNKKRTFKITSIKEMPYTTVILIGLFQCLALIPGTSRSGVTILGAMLLLCNRECSAEFSFFLSIPVMAGASLLKIVKYFLNGNMFDFNEWLFTIIGCLVAFVVSFFCVKWLMKFVKKHDFAAFGYYRIIIGILVLVLYLTGVLKTI